MKSDWKSGRIWDSDAWAMIEYKTNYISQKRLPYNAFIFGGTKSGSIQPRTLKAYTGSNFYNYWMNGGCFENYAMFLNYILKIYKDINEIIICLSSHEVDHYKAVWKLTPSKMQNFPFMSIIIQSKILEEKFLNVNNFVDLYRNRNLENLEPLSHNDGSRDISRHLKKRDENSSEYIKTRVLP